MREGLHKVVPSGDTIVAISTPLGRSGIGVVRVSGGDSRAITARYLRTPHELLHRNAVVGCWLDDDGSPIDDVVVTYYQAPRSYTGEDVVEISAHGNPVVLGRIVQSVQKSGGRIAAPGEFTLRAVTNGKMDLTQAEAVLDFINSQTDAQARTARLQLGGAISNKLRPPKERVVDVIARMEAGIDFAEDDLETPDGAGAAAVIHRICAELEQLQQTYGYGKLLAHGIRLAIVGKPNVGKSSIFNRLIAADRAIVTEIPGTTRDVLTETANFEGIPLRVFDTAGLRETTDPVEQIGVARALETFSEADVVLIVLDGSVPLTEQDSDLLTRARDVAHVVVANKVDLPPAFDISSLGLQDAVSVSAKTGEGFDRLRNAIRAFLHSTGAEILSDCILTNARQNESVVRAIESLRNAQRALLNGTPHEMALLDLYEGLGALGELTGEVVTDDILDRIFSTFCVGK